MWFLNYTVVKTENNWFIAVIHYRYKNSTNLSNPIIQNNKMYKISY